MTGKSVKDVDRYQAVLANLLLEEDNKFCADCQSKGNASGAPVGDQLPGRRAWRWPEWGGGSGAQGESPLRVTTRATLAHEAAGFPRAWGLVWVSECV